MNIFLDADVKEVLIRDRTILDANEFKFEPYEEPAVVPVISIADEPATIVKNDVEHHVFNQEPAIAVPAVPSQQHHPPQIHIPVAPIPTATLNHSSSPQKKPPSLPPVSVAPPPHHPPKSEAATVKAAVVKKEWDRDERRKVETRNNNMRQIIYKEVKRPGRNYDRLLELLKELHGPAEIRQQYILDVIKEATRFKRNHMAKIILQNMPNLVSIDSSS